MDKNIVLYHRNCADGLGAAYAAFKVFGDNANYIPINYGEEPPEVSEKNVFILDFSFPKDKLIKMKKLANSLVVLDHHKTAYEDLKDLDFAIFDMNKSGAGLAWEYFHKTEMPKFIKLIQDRDLWKFELDDSKFFNDGLRAYVNFDVKSFSKLEDDNYVNELIVKGKDIRFIFENDIEQFSKYAAKINLYGETGLVCFVPPKFSSELGSKLALKSGTYGCTVKFNGKDGQRQNS